MCESASVLDWWRHVHAGVLCSLLGRASPRQKQGACVCGVCVCVEGRARARERGTQLARPSASWPRCQARWRKTQLVGLSVPEPPNRRGAAGAGRAERRSWVGPGRGALRSAARRALSAPRCPKSSCARALTGVPRAAAHGGAQEPVPSRPPGSAAVFGRFSDHPDAPTSHTP
jgi:hypothetical protein